MTQRIHFILLLVLIPCFSLAQEFTVDLEIRPRLEIRNGFKTPIPAGVSPAAFVEQRSRLGLNFNEQPLTVRLTLQDVRIWGDHPQIYKADPALTNVFEAWAQYRFDADWTVRFGRMQLDYDNARFLGSLDWAQQGRSHDALLITHRYQPASLSLHAGVTWNQAQIAEPGRLIGNFYPLSASNNKSMQFLWLNHTNESFTASLLIHNDGRQLADSSMSYMQTIGGFTRFLSGELTIEADAYVQFGSDASGNSVSAWFAGVAAGRDLDDFRLTVGLDYASGSEYNSTKNRSFMPLYGTNHKFYGLMDYFYVGSPFRQPLGNFDTGFLNVFQKLTWFASDNLQLAVHVHQFQSATDVYVIDGNTGDLRSLETYLGTEVDFMVTWRPAPAFTLTAGYSRMFQSDTMNIVKGVGNPSGVQSWTFLMLRAAPRVFSSSR